MLVSGFIFLHEQSNGGFIYTQLEGEGVPKDPRPPCDMSQSEMKCSREGGIPLFRERMPYTNTTIGRAWTWCLFCKRGESPFVQTLRSLRFDLNGDEVGEVHRKPPIAMFAMENEVRHKHDHWWCLYLLPAK